MHGTEGEAYANPLRCPQIHHIVGGEQRVLLERTLQDETPALPAAKDAATTARWTERCLAGEVAIPQAIQRQVACCLVRRRERDAGAGAETPASGLSATILGYFLIG